MSPPKPPLLLLLLSLLFQSFSSAQLQPSPIEEQGFLIPTSPPRPCPVILPKQPAAPDDRIVGGQLSQDATALFMVSLFTPQGKYRCSGVLLSKRWVLTAAHCDITTSWTARVAGDRASSGALRNISAVRLAEPPGYTIEVRDSALLQLSHDAPSNAEFVPINADPNIPPIQAFVRAVGYGREFEDEAQSSNMLRQVDIPVTTFAFCKSIYRTIADDKVCAGYGDGGCDSCQGDSGGPLLLYDKYARPVVIATVSSGIGCARPATPGVYMRTSAVIDWITSVGADFRIANDFNVILDETPPLSPLPAPSSQPSFLPFPTPSSLPAPTVCPVVLPQHPPRPQSKPRIVGGSLSSRTTARYLAAISSSLEYRCSGVLISKRWVLTTAHCQVQTSYIVRIGGLDGTSGEQYNVDSVFTPKQTNTSFPTSFSEDIALVKLSKDAPKTASFAKLNSNLDLPETGAFARAAGYGRTDPVGVSRGGEELRQVDVPIVPMNRCFDAYEWVTEDRVCAGYPDGGCDACFGDGGGPLLQFDQNGHPVVVGLSSGGLGCALAGFPGVYMRVAPFLSWMRSVGADFTTAARATQFTRPTRPSPTPPSVGNEIGGGCPEILPQLPAKSDDRIVGGAHSSLKSAEYMAALWDTGSVYRCTGIRLSRRWVLTAGVTCGVTNEWTVTLGKSTTGSGRKFSIVEVFNASNGTDLKEITLIRLTDMVFPATSFALVNTKMNVPVPGSFARVMGYGSNEAGNTETNGLRLRQVDMPVSSTRQCQEAWQADFLFDNLVCVGYTQRDCGICWGDEGGPLVQFDKQNRLVVVGAAFTNVQCGTEGVPSLFARTAPVIEWMRDIGVDFVPSDSVESVFRPA